MLTDFGMEFQKVMPNKVAVGKKYVARNNVLNKIKEIDKKFHLIILAESKYFEDSIILLKYELFWNYEDVINLKHNSNSLRDFQTNKSLKLLNSYNNSFSE